MLSPSQRDFYHGASARKVWTRLTTGKSRRMKRQAGQKKVKIGQIDGNVARDKRC